MKEHQWLAKLEADGLLFGAGAISEALEGNKPKQKRQTIKIKLPRKPAAPRSSAIVKHRGHHTIQYF
ncbi:MAG TPA: hypothetical protein VG938_16890 [Verrucomicrobiae bacterium]|jgi:hypothetical protein|nr:hypothetical protein [Verrucomicrobiae bacterium]